MIYLDKITIGYKKKKVIEELSFIFPDYGMVAVVGKSGRGKTTLINTIGGILEPLEGKVLYSSDIAEIKDSAAYIFQDRNILDNLTVLENIKLLLEIVNIKYDENEVLELLKELEIDLYATTKVGFISGGERQRVAVAIAILRKAKVIIADEPDSSLDSESGKIVLDNLKKLSKDILVIFTTHNMNIVEEYADAILDLEKMDKKAIVIDSSAVEKHKSKKHIRLKNLLLVEKKVLQKKKVQRVFSIIIFAVLTLALAFLFSVMGYSKTDAVTEHLLKSEYDELQIEYPILYPEDQKLDLEKYGIETHLQLLGGLSFYNINYDKEDTDYYKGYIIRQLNIDDTLGDFEIEVTDYSLLALRYYEGISFDNIDECLGKKVYIELGGEYTEFTITKIKKTEFLQIEAENAPFELVEYYRPDLYSGNSSFLLNATVNTKTCFAVKYDEDSQELIRVDEGYFNAQDAKLQNDYELTRNEVLVSQNGVDIIEKKVGHKIEIGDSFVFNFIKRKDINVSIELKLKGIAKYAYTPNIYFSSDMMYHIDYLSSDVYNNISSRFYLVNFHEHPEGLKLLVEDAYANGIRLEYRGMEKMDSLFQTVNVYKKTALFVVAICLVLALIMVAYNIYTTYALNSRSFAILSLYGMNKKYKLLVMQLSNFFQWIIACIIGFVGVYFMNLLFDDMLKVIKDLPHTIQSYKFVFSIYAALIVFVFSALAILVGHLLSLIKKNGSHIQEN